MQVNEYEIFNEKTAEFTGLYLSDKMLEKCDIITFQGENYIVSDLIIPSDRKLRVAVWPSKIKLPIDIEDHRFLHWIQQNLIGLKIRLSNDKNSIEGRVIDYWPGKRFIPPDFPGSGERTETFFAEEFPLRLEILSLGPDDPSIIDLLDFSVIEIIGNQGMAI